MLELQNVDVILFCTLECSANQVKSFSIASWQCVSKWTIVSVKASTFGTSLPSLLFKVAGNPKFSRSTNLESKLIEFFVSLKF